MLNLNDIQRKIKRLESKDCTYDDYVVLASLYAIEDRIIDEESKAYQEAPAKFGVQNQNGEEEVGKINRGIAENVLSKIKNPDGTIGPHWTLSQAKDVMAKHELSGSPSEFWIALCLMYADYSAVAKKMNISTMDFYINMAEAFLEDHSKKSDKVAKYCKYVVS